MEPEINDLQPITTIPNLNDVPIQTEKPRVPTIKKLCILSIGIICLFMAAGTAAFYFLANKPPITIQNSPSTTDSNPKIDILATLPPEDPAIVYEVLVDPSHIAAYTIDTYKYTASHSAVIVVGGKIGKKYQEINQLLISPDGKNVAYIAKDGEKEFVVVNEVEGKKYEYVKNLKLSPDGQHVAYAAGEGRHEEHGDFEAWEEVNNMFVVVDEIEGKKYDGTYVDTNLYETYNPSFSKDGKKITYTAIKNGENIIVVDDQEIANYLNPRYPQFIGDTYDLIYLASEKNQYFMVLADKKQRIHDYISDLNEFPYFLGKDASQIAYYATDNSNDRAVVVNDNSYPITSGVLQYLAFSNSGKYTAYYTGTWMSKDLWINDKRFGTVQPDATINIGAPVFSPDEQLLVFGTFSQQQQNAAIHVISTQSLQTVFDYQLPGYRAIGPIKFSDDGKSIYFKGWHDRSIVLVTFRLPPPVPQ